MSDVESIFESAVEEVTEAPQEEAAETQELSVDDRARTMGWVPEDEYKGNPEHWRPADEFVQKFEEDDRVMRSTYKRVEQKNVELQNQLSEMSTNMDKMVEFMTATKQKEINDLKKQLETYVEVGDVEGAKRVNDAIVEASAPEPVQQPQPNGMHPEAQAFIERNSWMRADSADHDEVMVATAVALENQLASRFPDMKERLTEVERQMNQRFNMKPESAPTTPRQVVSESRRSNPQAPKKAAFNSLPDDVKRQFETTRTWMKNAGKEYTKDQFMEQYNAMEGN